MKNNNINKIVLSIEFVALLLLVSFNFYLIGYLRDYSIYNYKFLFNLNLIILPITLIFYFYLKNDYRILKFILYFSFTSLLILNIYFNSYAHKSISIYEIGHIDSITLSNMQNNYIGKIYFYKDDCPLCKNLTAKIESYNKLHEEKILMYNTNSDLKNKDKFIKHYNITGVPAIVKVNYDGEIYDITNDFLDI